MSSSIDKPSHGADPWWGEPESDVLAGFDAPAVGAARRTSATGTRRRVRKRTPWWVRPLRLPFTLFGRAVRRSPRLRKLLIRLVIVGVVSVGIAGSVGVILLNNIVIHRTAELGKLDQERRDLRRDNAVLDATGATKSAQTQIMSRAQRQLGMVHASGAPQYEYLDPQSSDQATKKRAQRAARAAHLAAVAAAAQQRTTSGKAQ